MAVSVLRVFQIREQPSYPGNSPGIKPKRRYVPAATKDKKMKTIVLLAAMCVCAIGQSQEPPPTHCQNCCLILGQIGNNGSAADFLEDEIDELQDQINELYALFGSILNDPKYSPAEVDEAALNIQMAMDMIQAQITLKQAELDALNSETHALWELWLAANCAGC